MNRALLDESPSVVHFCGHAIEDGIMLLDDNGLSKLVPRQALADFLVMFDSLECVLFNACKTAAVAEDTAKAGIPAAIGMKQPIHDPLAIKFAIAFYDAIFAGKDYKKSFDIACASLALENGLDALEPVIFEKILF